MKLLLDGFCKNPFKFKAFSGMRIALSASWMTTSIKTLALLLMALTIGTVLPAARAAEPGDCMTNMDALFWKPSNDETKPQACHSSRGIDVEAHVFSDLSTGERIFTPGFGAHYDLMGIDAQGFMVAAKLRFDFAAAGENAAFEAQGEISIDKLFCSDPSHCFFVGGTFGHDGNSVSMHPNEVLSGAEQPLYIRYTAGKLDGEAGYLITKNNETLILKAITGASLDYQPLFDKNSLGFGGDVGASAEYYSRTRLVVIASVIEHLDLFALKNNITEEKLQLRVRLHRKSDANTDTSFLKDIYWQMQVRAYQGELTHVPANGNPSQVRVNTGTAETGVILGF